MPLSGQPCGLAHARLTRRAEYLAVRAGTKRRGRLFLLEVLDRKDESAPRIGYTVTKKSGNAVERNRIRRRLAEAVRVSAAAAMRPGHDYVVVGRPDILTASFDTLTAELFRRFRGAASHG